MADNMGLMTAYRNDISYDDGKIKKLAQRSLWISSFDMQICEGLHFVFGHMVMQSLCGDQIRTSGPATS